MRNRADVSAFTSIVSAEPSFISTLETSTPISDHVGVDFELRVSISKRQLIEVVDAFLHQRRPNVRIPTRSELDVLGGARGVWSRPYAGSRGFRSQISNGARNSSPSTTPMNTPFTGRISNRGIDIGPDQWPDIFEEEHVEWSNALHARIKERLLPRRADGQVQPQLRTTDLTSQNRSATSGPRTHLHQPVPQRHRPGGRAGTPSRRPCD